MSTRGSAPELAGYTFVDDIGPGGFADVFLFEQTFPMRKVAIKVLRDAANTPLGLQQFHAEANVMAKLSGHSSIVGIYDAAVARDGRPYIVMEYCPPPTLGGRFRAEQIPVPEALEIGTRIASAVETANRADILHRDIKPHNILTSAGGRPKLADFGIAGAAGGSSSAYGMSVPWAPPESFSDSPPADVRSDVYSLAATVYSLLAGRSPFEVLGGANDNPTLMSRIEHQPLSRITRHDVPDSLNDVLSRAMSKRIDDRPLTALDFALQLQAVQKELGLPVERIEVLDAGLPAGAAVDSDPRTLIRPVSIIVQERTDQEGTRLRPRFVTPVDDHTKRKAHQEALSPVETQGTLATSEPEVDASPRRPSPWILGGGVLVGLLVAAALATIAFTGGDDRPPPSNPNAFGSGGDVPNALAGYIAPPTNTASDPSVPGKVTFTWGNPDPQPGDQFIVSWTLANKPQPVATVKEPTFTANGSNGQIACVEISVVRADASASLPGQQVCVEVQ